MSILLRALVLLMSFQAPALANNLSCAQLYSSKLAALDAPVPQNSHSHSLWRKALGRAPKFDPIPFRELRPLLRQAFSLSHQIPQRDEMVRSAGTAFYSNLPGFSVSYGSTRVTVSFDPKILSFAEMDAILQYASQFGTGDATYNRFAVIRNYTVSESGRVSFHLKTKDSAFDFEYEKPMTLHLDQIFTAMNTILAQK